MEDLKNNKIRIIYTAKAKSAFDSLILKFNLEETPENFIKKIDEKKDSNVIVIDQLLKNLAKGNISQKDALTSLQNATGVSHQISEKILNEIVNNIIPNLEKVPEEKLKDRDFVDQISQKISSEQFQTKNTPIGVAEVLKQKIPLAKEGLVEQNLIIEKETVAPGPTEKPLPKAKVAFEEASLSPRSQGGAGAPKGREPAPKPKIQRKDDYREPIE